MGEPPSDGLRERKRQRTRHALEDAALRLFSTQGFAQTPVSRIAEQAEVSTRTFFHHFPTKEDVVLAAYERRLASLVDLLAERPWDEPPLTALRSSLLAVAEDYQRDRHQLLERARLIAANTSIHARSLELQSRWEERIAATVAHRLDVEVEHDLRPRLLAAITFAAMRVAQRRWLHDDGATALPQLVAEALDLLERGLAEPGSVDQAPDREP